MLANGFVCLLLISEVEDLTDKKEFFHDEGNLKIYNELIEKYLIDEDDENKDERGTKRKKL